MSHELPYYVLRYAHQNKESKSGLLGVYEANRQLGLLTRSAVNALKHKYGVILSEYLQTEVRILASTLSNSAHEPLSLQSFEPDFVVCDESGQCLEGEHIDRNDEGYVGIMLSRQSCLLSSRTRNSVARTGVLDSDHTRAICASSKQPFPRIGSSSVNGFPTSFWCAVGTLGRVQFLGRAHLHMYLDYASGLSSISVY
jgi:hypothetical protein